MVSEIEKVVAESIKWRDGENEPVEKVQGEFDFAKPQRSFQRSWSPVEPVSVERVREYAQWDEGRGGTVVP
jgi:hypothetical protein